jgi:ornithine decarboxylase
MSSTVIPVQFFSHTSCMYLCAGGGYPGTDSSHLTFQDVATTVSAAIDRYFPLGCGVDIIAEPGRYFVCASHAYAVSVIAKRELNEEQLADAKAIEAFGTRHDAQDEASEEELISMDEGEQKKAREAQVALYINDGVYGSFNCVVFDHAIVVPRVLVRKSGEANVDETIPTKIFGPTCDSIDVVLSSYELPAMNVGDWLFFDEMGAYTR